MQSGEGLAEAERICGQFDDTFLYLDEVDMMNDFIALIEDADVLSGWNSEVLISILLDVLHVS